MGLSTRPPNLPSRINLKSHLMTSGCGTYPLRTVPLPCIGIAFTCAFVRPNHPLRRSHHQLDVSSVLQSPQTISSLAASASNRIESNRIESNSTVQSKTKQAKNNDDDGDNNNMPPSSAIQRSKLIFSLSNLFVRSPGRQSLSSPSTPPLLPRQSQGKPPTSRPISLPIPTPLAPTRRAEHHLSHPYSPLARSLTIPTTTSSALPPRLPRSLSDPLLLPQSQP